MSNDGWTRSHRDPSIPGDDLISIYSIGHSNHSLARFLQLLATHSIEVVADVRSVPASSRSPHFNQSTLAAELPSVGKKYLFMGQQLGGRPADPSFYDPEGYVLYEKLAKSQSFGDGIERICKGAQKYRVALLCSEEDPLACHRQLLIGRVLTDQGLELLHIRADGSVQPARDIQIPTETHQMALFEARSTKGSWRSPKPLWRIPDERLYDRLHPKERAPVF
ncbi:MAG TPA: DUF488 domain-containing protein [Chloroflexota bacterium]|jgi:uncharacterized protein (DUF488 family)